MRLSRVTGSRRRNINRRRATGGVALGTAALLALTLSPTSAMAPSAVKTAEQAADRDKTPSAKNGHPDNFDSRDSGASQKVLAGRESRLREQPKAGVKALRGQLGIQGVVSLDPLTSTPRTISRLDGYLTGATSRAPLQVVLGYVRSHPDVFNLDAQDLRTLNLRKTYTDVAGIRHLSLVQYAGGVPVFGNGLKANVSRSGQLISVQGSPVHGLGRLDTSPRITPGGARSAAIKNVEGSVRTTSSRTSTGRTRKTTFGDGDRASLVAFQTVSGIRLAWQTLTTPGQGRMFSHVVDAESGKVLFRRDLVQSDNGDVWDYWPGAPAGGTRRTVDLTTPGWLQQGSTRLAGNNTHVYSDVNDDNVAQKSEEVGPGAKSFRFPFVNFSAVDGAPCSAKYQCSWTSDADNSWKKNRKQNAVQVFYYVNKFHGHLKKAPIGFTRAAGNFEAVDDDAVQAQPDDGADTAGGHPDSNHVDNANMATPVDGLKPVMQMYLFHDPADPTDPFLQSNGGDEGDIVYHEYTHGLSNRLVVDADGNSTLGSIQAGSMGEAWSDWYAMDYLNNLRVQKDTSAPGEVLVGDYVGAGQDLIRTQPLDCPVGTTSAKCPGTTGGGPGGYTYGDFGQIIGRPEVHADGEIWGETLWDLRRALGSKVTESLVTRAMELSPSNPSFLDERNSILQADTVTAKGAHRDKIWAVFAHRGMGYFAGSVDGDDAEPVEDFSLPPSSATPKGSLTGTVTDDASGDPVDGTTVAFGGHASGFPTDYAATTAADGTYTISGIFAGTYPKVYAGGQGYDRQVRTISIAARANTADWVLRRDWAALSGGADVTRTNDDTGAPFGCGASAMFDQSQGTGWSAERVISGGVVTPVYVIVKLPKAIDVTEIAVDPSNTCGDAGSASTGPYSIETSTNGTTWKTASSGTFTPADRDRFNSPALASGSKTAVRYVRYTMKDSQVNQVGSCPGPFGGCDFIDSRELEVYGAPAATP